jgi:hypothetical protein
VTPHNPRDDIALNDSSGRDGAIFSPCMTWRYSLRRDWSDMLTPPRVALWIMLNPSTADHLKLDPTVTRCREFSRAWGYTALEVVNLFALRSTDPEGLYAHADPVGPGNDHYIARAAEAADLIVCAWGNHAALHTRGRAVTAALSGRLLHALRLNGSGHPAHPLYLPGSLQPQPWTPWQGRE